MDTAFPKGTAVISYTDSSPDCCSTEHDLLLLGMSYVVQISGTCLRTISAELLKLGLSLQRPLSSRSLPMRAHRQFNESFSGAKKDCMGISRKT